MSLRFSADFPTGNGHAVADGDVLTVDRDLRDSTGDRWYWHLRLHSSRDRTVQVRPARRGLVGRHGPAVRTASGYRWLWDRPASADTFTLQLTAGETVSVSATLPYGPAELAQLRQRTSGGEVRWQRLTTSEDGRQVPVLMSPARQPRQLLLLTARHHACEATASHVFDGAVAAFVQRRRQGDPWATSTTLLGVPFMDVDGVWRGDQGKARTPWDHNRDYGPRPRYRSVAALSRLVAGLRLPLSALDLHTPGLRGPLEEQPYVVCSGDPEDSATAATLAILLGHARKAPPPKVLVFDEAWNSIRGRGRRGCAAWLRTQPTTRWAQTIEYPNAMNTDGPVSAAAARRFGTDLINCAAQMMY